MITRTSNAEWKGDLKSGNGKLKLGSGGFEGEYTFASRFQQGEGTNPEELIGAAHAGCFSMALSADLAENGYEPKSVQTSADVNLEEVEGDFAITSIVLNTEAEIPGIKNDEFQKFANGAKENCPVSNLLKHGAEIKVNAKLK